MFDANSDPQPIDPIIAAFIPAPSDQLKQETEASEGQNRVVSKIRKSGDKLSDLMKEENLLESKLNV